MNDEKLNKMLDELGNKIKDFSMLLTEILKEFEFRIKDKKLTAFAKK